MIVSHLRLAWSSSFLCSASYVASFLRSHSIYFEAHSSSYTTSIHPTIQTPRTSTAIIHVSLTVLRFITALSQIHLRAQTSL